MPSLLLVMAGGAIGAGFRYRSGRVAAAHFGAWFPWRLLGLWPATMAA